MGSSERPSFLERLAARKKDRVLEAVVGAISGSPIAAAWSLLLFLGGATLLIYFWHIDYFPQLTLEAIVSVLAAVSIATILALFFTAVILVVPGAFWGSTTRKALVGIGVSPQNVWLTFGLFMYLLVAYMLSVVGAAATERVFDLFAFIAIASILPVTLVLMFKPESAGSPFPHIVVIIFYAVIAALLACLGGWVVLAFANGLENHELFLLVGFLLFCNGMLAVQPQRISSTKWTVGIGVIVLYVLLVVGGLITKVPMGVVKTLKLGNLDAVLVLDKQTCESIPALSAVPVANGCHTPRVHVLSRMGGEYYIEQSGTDGNMNRYLLPAASVKGVHMTEAGKEKKREAKGVAKLKGAE